MARGLSALRDVPGGPGIRILGCSADPDHARAAVSAGVVDEAVTDEETLAGRADLLVYAVPLDVLVRLLPEHAHRWRPGAVVTDVASLKVPVARALRGVMGEERFVGSHPMAGSEQSGFRGARADLYRGARVWICPSEASHPRAVEEVAAVWAALGGVPMRTEAPDHDALMARASHLPQVVANALAALLAREGLVREDLGPGGRDMTRLAASSSEMWLPLLARSGPEVAELLRALAAGLEEVARSLEEGDLDAMEALMVATRGWSEG